MKFYNCYVLILLASSLLCSCTKVSNETEEHGYPPQNSYTMMVMANKEENSLTRALTLNGRSLNATWKEGETVEVYFGNNKVGTLTAQESGASTRLKGQLSGKFEVGQELKLYFPKKVIDYSSQIGTLDDVANRFDQAIATVKVNNIDDTILYTEDAVFSNRQSIVQFSLRDKRNRDLIVNELIISGDNIVTNSNGDSFEFGELTIKPESATKDFYVSILSIGSCNQLSLTAKATDGITYTYTKRDVAFSANKFYSIKVNLAGDAFVKDYEEISIDNIGWRVGSDGKAYSPTGDMPDGVRAVGIIAYVGEETAEEDFTHGLAIAMRNANNDNACSWKTSSGGLDNPKQYSIEGGVKYKESGSLNSTGKNSDEFPAFKAALNNSIRINDVEDYVSATAPSNTSGWFLPSLFQWNKVVKSMCGTEADLSRYNNTELCLDKSNNMIMLAGGEILSWDCIWVSTETDTGSAMYNHASGGFMYYIKKDYDGNDGIGKVRAVLAF